MEFNLADLFEAVADAVGERTAIVAGARRLTYDALDRRANRLAHLLEEAGVGEGDRVGLQLVNGTEYIEGMLACFKVRAVPVNVNYRYVADELRSLYADADLVALIYNRRFGPAVIDAQGAMPERRLVLCVTGDPQSTLPGGSAPGADYESELDRMPAGRGFAQRSADDRYIVYTGGTTGMPKGVVWRQEDIFFAAMGGGDPLAFGNHIKAPAEIVDRVLPVGVVALAIPPFMHSSGHWLAFSNLLGGGTLVTLPGGQFDPETVWRVVESERVNVVVVVGDAMARPMVERLERDPDRFDTSSLMAFGSGGAVLSPSTKQRLAMALPNVIVADRFGSSETGQVGGEVPSDDPFGAPRLRVDELTTVLDDDGLPVAPGSETVGRLARSGHLPLGYLGDPEKTSATFPVVAGRRWVLPGDLAVVGADGVITILGREATCINTGGEKVFPDEVEGVLKAHPAVADAVVVGLPDERFGQRVVAVVAVQPNETISAEALRDHCRGRLTSYKIPRQLAFCDSVVRSPSGKPDYHWAREAAEALLARTG